tara:strand:- start:764 stop:1315 length:552 start_codon:yes stop_codon:yes gene_type:complete
MPFLQSVYAPLAGLLAATVSLAGAAEDCPEYLNQELRKLHSSDTVNLCDIARGKPLLVVNTASHCGFTPQFKGLEALYQQYREKGLQVVGFASDDFRQAAKDEATAATVCYVNYGVTFTMFAPTAVKGPSANPVFAELGQQTEPPGWNFNKYVVDASGRVVAHFGSSTSPDSAALRAAIDSVL